MAPGASCELPVGWSFIVYRSIIIVRPYVEKFAISTMIISPLDIEDSHRQIYTKGPYALEADLLFRL